MSTHRELLEQIQAAKVRAAEEVVAAAIPRSLLEMMEKANAKFAAEGGCRGCISKTIGVHFGRCKEAGYD